jgi:nicotinamidase-related amidase
MTTPNTALIVIDVQEEYFSGALQIEHPARDGSLARIGDAMDAATARGNAVVVIRQNGPDPLFATGSPTWVVRPEVLDRPHDVLIDKRLPGAFTGTDLEAWLHERGIGQVAIAGYMTNVCCDTTARQAFHLGLDVTLLHDATGVPPMPTVGGDLVPARTLHEAALAPLAMVGIELATTQEWIARRSAHAAASSIVSGRS